MERNLILVEEYCTNCSVETSFIDSLEELGLIEVIEMESQRFIDDAFVPDLEKFTAWHYDLDISPAGIDTIHELLQRMESMQHEIDDLKRRLRFFD